jgi:DNA-directed RNA polymerase sigma subunit (sigma70/sigma32)
MRKPNKDIDCALQVLATMVSPGERLSVRTIADICGCSQTAIHLIEQSALRKLRKRLRQELKMSYAEFSEATVGKV